MTVIMKRQTWLRHRIPTNTRAPLAAYTCLILGQTSPPSGIMWCSQNDSFNHGDGNHQKSLLLSGCLRPLAARLRHFSDLLLAAWRPRSAWEPMSSEGPWAHGVGAHGEGGRDSRSSASSTHVASGTNALRSPTNTRSGGSQSPEMPRTVTRPVAAAARSDCGVSHIVSSCVWRATHGDESLD